MNDELETNKQFGIELIRKLKPCKFKFKNENSNKFHFGLIAQDVAEVLNRDEFSIVGERNNFLTIDYLQLISVLIKAVQQSDEKISKLESQLQIIKDKLYY